MAGGVDCRAIMLKRLLLGLLCAGAVSAFAQELLEPEQAFRFSARAIDSSHIEARWQIADGYYMYRDKFVFALDGARGLHAFADDF